MDRKAWHAAIHGVTKSQTQQSDSTELKHYYLGGLKTNLPTKPTGTHTNCLSNQIHKTEILSSMKFYNFKDITMRPCEVGKD